MLKAFRIRSAGPTCWRTAAEVVADNCLGLAAQLSHYFFLALFPALLFLVALISFIPVENLMDTIRHRRPGGPGRSAEHRAGADPDHRTTRLAACSPGMIGTIWSSSAGVTAIIDSLNQAYDIQEGVRGGCGQALVSRSPSPLHRRVHRPGGGRPALAEKVAEWFTWARPSP
jgi:uncharacterized BrkB/YihY/UPF0761 family membrane protein